MEITGTTSQINDYINQQAKAIETEAMYQIKLMKMQQQSDAIVGTLLEDVADISQEAMDMYLSEIKG